MRLKKSTGLIVALDTFSKAKAIAVAKVVSDYADAFKIGYPLLLDNTLEIIADLKRVSKFPIIVDIKLADIPEIVGNITHRLVASGADGIIVQGFVGPDSIRAAVGSSKGKDIFVVAEMSNPGAELFLKKEAIKIAKLAKFLKTRGIIAPATRPDEIKKLRKIVGNDFFILSPGIGPQGGSIKQTVKAGADFVIIGRAILQAKNPAKAVENIVNEIKSVK